MKFLLIAFSVFSSLFYLNNSLALANPNCSDPQTQLEMTFCAKQDFLAADEKLNRVYQKVFSKLSSPHKSALKKAQRAWISYRDLACHSYGLAAEGGTMQAMLVNNCLAEVTNQRTKLLEQQVLGN